MKNRPRHTKNKKRKRPFWANDPTISFEGVGESKKKKKEFGTPSRIYKSVYTRPIPPLDGAPFRAASGASSELLDALG